MSRVVLYLEDRMNIGIHWPDRKYQREMIDCFTGYVDGFQFMPKYRSGTWNGKISMIKTGNSIPYGLLFDFIKEHKKNFSDDYEITVTDEVKSLFKNTAYEPIFDLKHYPYEYQEDCIRAALLYSKGIIRSATASGKSLVITYILKTLLENNDKSNVYQSLIIVPSTSLVEQFRSDMIDYGIPEGIIGRVYTGYKEWDQEIVISTWQSLNNNKERMAHYGAIVVDEVHSAKAHVLKELLSQSYNANYRFGFTGTMHSSDLDNWNVKSYIGPVIREYSSGFLADEGFISKCNLHMVNIDYNDEYKNGDYNEMKEIVFNNQFRLDFINKLVSSLDDNVLLLVGLVEKEGEVLEGYLNRRNILDNNGRVYKFLSGRDKVDEREVWRQKCLKENNIGLIATYGIFQQGINIPNLKYIIFASPFKSKIRVLQSVGRSLRKYSNKKDGAHVFDLVDNTKFFKDHGDKRLRFYDMEGFNIIESSLSENKSYNIENILQP